MQLYLGSEIYVDSEDAEDMKSIIKKIRKGIYPTLNGTNYVLIEFYLGGFVLEDISKDIMRLTDAGYTPVIAHAERYGVSYDSLCELKEMGCLMQLNLCDVRFDSSNEMCLMATKMLDNELFDFIGTDAHGMDRRSPTMKSYIDQLYNRYNKNYIDELTWKNAEKFLGVLL